MNGRIPLQLRIAALLAATAVTTMGVAQSEQEWVNAWPADSSIAVAVGDSIELTWNAPSVVHESFGIEDLILLTQDPRRTGGIDSIPMDVRVTVEVRATMNPDHGDYDFHDDYDSLMVFQFLVGIRGDSISPMKLSRDLDRIDSDAALFLKSHRYTLLITGIEVDRGDGWETDSLLPKRLYFDLVMRWKRYAPLNLSGSPGNTNITPINCPPMSSGTTYELLLSWNAMPGAIGYDVEWTWVDNYTYSGTGIVPTPGVLSPGLINFDLNRDASRATVSGTQYRLPLLYDRGWIIWRVRGVGMASGGAGLFVHTQWAGPSNGIVSGVTSAHKILISEHQHLKNWQVTTSFAEEGKRKEVMTYADGTSRARQVVTRNNSLNVPIIGETVYDATGRPAVEVMPVPQVKGECEYLGQPWAPIDYNVDFNMQDDDGDPERFDFNDLTPSDGCGLAATPLHPVSGAERYYSKEFANDANALIPAPQFLPRAEGKPYAQTEYTRDNTGRVRRKGGVGEAFQLDAHPTTTLYGKPEQIQLDRLFGSEAGYATHYQRVVTIDPNGQPTVAYIDMFGRTVATSLACEAPEGMEPVGEANETLTTDLFCGLANTAPELGQRQGDALVFSNQVAVACEGEYQFSYNPEELTVTDPCWLESICLRCMYELELSIVDQCGESVDFDQSVSMPVTYGTMSASPTDEEMLGCSFTPLYGPLTLTVTLPQGEYIVRKTLRLNTAARDWYVERLITTNPEEAFTAIYGENASEECFRTYGDFLEDAMAEIELDGCDVSCADCYAAIGTLAQFLASGQGTEAQYRMLRDECDELCRVDSWCDVLLQNMTADMSLHGQYARFDGTMDNPSFPDQTSVFRPFSALRKKFPPTGDSPIAWKNITWNTPLWRQPWLEIDGQVFQEYRSTEGERMSILAVSDGAGNFIPPAAVVGQVEQIDADTYRIWPENLANISDFLAAWQGGWERSLIRFHPEYCYYIDCKRYGEPYSAYSDPDAAPTTSDRFDGYMGMRDTYQDAAAANLLTIVNTPTNHAVPNVANLDPFLTSSAYSTYNGELLNKIANYVTLAGQPYSMMQVATVSVRLNGQYSGTIPPFCEAPAPGMPDTRTEEWAAFRAMYQSAKYAVQKRHADLFASQSNCECPGLNYGIGQENMGWQYRAYALSSTQPWWMDWSSLPPHQYCQPVNHATWSLYSSKLPRVHDPSVIPGMNQTPAQLAYQTFLQNGQCPMATAWLQLFSDLYDEDETVFEIGGTIDISNKPGWYQVNMALNNMELSTPVPPASIGISVSPSTADITFTVDGCSAMLFFPTGATDFDWSNVVMFAQLNANPNTNAFTLHVHYLHSDGTPDVAAISGTMCAEYDLAPCNFPRECEPNQFALQLQDLFNMVQSSENLVNADDLDLSSFPLAGSNTTAQDLLGQSITTYFDLNATPGIVWDYDPSGPSITLSQDGTAQLRFVVLEFDPPTFDPSADWGDISYFADINGAYENFFTLNGYDANGLIVNLRLQAWRILDGSTEPLSIGQCGLPANPQCDTPEATLAEDLARVLNDLIYGPDFGVGQLDFFASPNMTDAIAQQFCPQSDQEIEDDVPPDAVATVTSQMTYYEIDLCGCLTVEVPKQSGAPFGTGLQPTGVSYSGPLDGPFFTSIKIPILPNLTNFLRVTNSCGGFMACDTCLTDWTVQESSGMTTQQLFEAKFLQADEHWPDYLAYRAALDSLNEHLGYSESDSLYVPAVSFIFFRAKGLRHSLRTYLPFLRNFDVKVDLRAYLLHPDKFVAHYGNKTNVREEFERYLKAVDDYDARAVADEKPVAPRVDYFDFNELSLADANSVYVKHILGMAPTNQAPQSITAFADFEDQAPCAQIYLQGYLSNYVELETQSTDSTHRCHGFQRFAPLVSYSDFVNANLCCSDSGLFVLDEYLQHFLNDSLSCPGPLPHLLACDVDTNTIAQMKERKQNCQQLYNQWVDAIIAYMAPSPYYSHYSVVLSISPYNGFDSFEGAGLCDCVLDYLAYLAPYLSWRVGDLPLPPVMDIHLFCSGEPHPCKDLFSVYLATVSDYNASAHSTAYEYNLDPTFTEYADLLDAGLCWCLPAYIAYLQGYLFWTSDASGDWPPPLKIERFCAGNSTQSCTGLYTAYLEAIISMQAQLYAINLSHGRSYQFIIATEAAFNQFGLCWCVEAYLARVEFLLSDPAANLSILDSDGSVWDIMRHCHQVVPCPTVPPPPATPFVEVPADPCPCCDDLEATAELNAQQAYQAYLEQLAREIAERYTETCLGAGEEFTMTFPDTEHHFTLYYYDQGGNLVRTVPPAGVLPTAITHPNDSIAARITADRANGTHSYFTDHRLVSDHQYNSLGQPIRSAMPDQDNRDEWQASLPLGLPPDMTITGISFGGGGKGFLTGHKNNGDWGLAYSTTNGGLNWQRAQGIVGATLRGAHYASATLGYAVGDHGTLLRTTDEGASWLLMGDDLIEQRPMLRDVFFNDEDNGIVVGLEGYAAFTTNATTTLTFSSITLPSTDHLMGVGKNANQYVIGAHRPQMLGALENDRGLLYTRASLGTTGWTATEQMRTAAALTCAQAIASTNEVYAAGSHGVLLHSDDSGENWTTRRTGTTMDFKDMAWHDALNGVALFNDGGTGVLRHTIDGGRTWLPIEDLPTGGINDLFLVTTVGGITEVLAVGDGGRVLRLFIQSNSMGFATIQGVDAGIDLTKGFASGAVAVVTDGVSDLLRVCPNLNAEPTAWVELSPHDGWAAFDVTGYTISTVTHLVVAAYELAAPSNRKYYTCTWATGGLTNISNLFGSAVDHLSIAPTNHDVVVAENLIPNTIVHLGQTGFPVTPAGTSATGAPSAARATASLGTDMWLSIGDAGDIRTDVLTGTTFTWEDHSTHIAPLPIRAVHKDGTLAAAAQGTVLRRDGTEWIAVPTRAVADLNGVERVNTSPESVVGVGDNSTAFSLDLLTPGSYSAFDLLPSGALHSVAATTNGLYISADNGRIWHVANVTTSPMLTPMNYNSGSVRAIAPLSNGSINAFGDQALVHAVAGLLRSPVQDVCTPPLRAVWCQDALTAYLVGEKSTVRKTNNGGLTWELVPVAGAISQFKAVHGNSAGLGFIVGNYVASGNRRALQLDQLDQDLTFGVGNAADILNSVAVAESGASLVGGANGTTGRAYRRNASDGSWSNLVLGTNATLRAIWPFPRYMADVLDEPYETSHEDFLVVGDAGYQNMLRYECNTTTETWSTLWSAGNTGNFGSGSARALWFHDRTAGFVVVQGASGVQLYRANGGANHTAAFTWNVAPSLAAGLNGQTNEALAQPLCIAFPDRSRGFVGGAYSGSPGGLARLIEDEGGLYSQRFWYDKLGRLVLSQNSKQAPDQRYSYSLYDALGRVYEAGELQDVGQSFRNMDPVSVSGDILPNVIDHGPFKEWVLGLDRYEVTRTLYDEPLAGLSLPITQKNLRLRVASTFFFDAWSDVNGPNDPLVYAHATHYSYDIHGNVRELVQDHPIMGDDGWSSPSSLKMNHRFKRMAYEYDLISGNVKRVRYQPGRTDQWSHRYRYDADNRITEVETSADGVHWQRDARYFYYPHGPLERTELGAHVVQGTDYAYTLQGWLKGINGDRLDQRTDMGRDGDPSLSLNPNLNVGRDAFAMSLGYYGDADYKGIGAAWDDDQPASIAQRPFAPMGMPGIGSTLATQHKPLYNGNIAHTVNTLQPFGLWGPNGQGQVLAMAYRYDQLNRLKKARGVIGLDEYNTWEGVDDDAATNRYRSEYEYDANGNMESAKRYTNAGDLYDDFEHRYHEAGGRRLRNRVYQILDLADQSGAVATDIHHRKYDDTEITDADDAFNTINSANNYGYDKIGRRIRDDQGEMESIEWTVSSKLKAVTRPITSTKKNLYYAYDAGGNRIMKQVGDPDMDVEDYREHYVRDALGNIMAVYRYTNSSSASLKQSERPIYGSSRLGGYNRTLELYNTAALLPMAYSSVIQKSHLRYELTDHLRNVAATVTGRLVPSASVTPMEADLVSAAAHEPFGLNLPGRHWQSDLARFGFQNQEKDLELNSVHFKYREYSLDGGGFWITDPLAAKFSWNSPYAFCENRVVDGVDQEGLEFLKADEARVEFKYGRLQVKVENMNGWSKVAYRDAARDPRNWSGNMIGIDLTLADVVIFRPELRIPELTDIELPSSMALPKSIGSTGAYNRAGRRDLDRRGPDYLRRIKPNFRSPQRGAVIAEAFGAAIENLRGRALRNDQGLIQQHMGLADVALSDVIEAVNMGMITEQEYLNDASLMAISNVVLSGVNTTNDPRIYELGMMIHDRKYNAPTQEEDAPLVPVVSPAVSESTNPR